ncbi:hypothetical protein C8R44DRAFT_866942 [Mycena epipterygia]|nr:hypothetical protein C8R44DRAFT_866942 [Mycena epipterygia]
MELMLGKLSYPESIRAGRPWRDEHGHLTTHYVDPATGEPLLVLVIGVLAEVLAVDGSFLRMLVLVPPEDAYLRGLFDAQQTVLSRIIFAERSDMSRTVVNRALWNHGGSSDEYGTIYVRLTDETLSARLDFAATNGTPLDDLARCAPVLQPPDVQLLEPGGLMAVYVDPFRADLPTAESENIYRRMYGLNASHTIRLFRSS